MNFNKSFLMTLGHNSSVIFYDCENNPIGYEEERLTGIKSDSSYPVKAFEKILSQLSDEQIRNSNVFISHWFDNFDIESFPSKYFSKSHFEDLVEKYDLNVIALSSSFTHHDAHAYSTLAFSENFPTGYKFDRHYIVVDGFGNNQEVVSIYRQKKGQDIVPIKRVYGFENSLGLLYQYATSFCGMKENQDEYKFLGYEVSIGRVLMSSQIEKLNIEAYKYSMNFMKKCLVINTLKPEKDYYDDSAIDFDCLRLAKASVHSYLENILHKLAGRGTLLLDEEQTRIIIGYFVQACLEQCLLRIIKKYEIKNVNLSGGCFLNVKLNKVILDNVPGYVCVNPLSGDQGAAIGLFRKYTKNCFDYSDLCFGVRNRIELSEATKQSLEYENIYVVENDDEFVSLVSSNLDSNKIVNVIQGNMEFGPRALCNTSTLALASSRNTHYINMVNDRNEVMPMAPVMLSSASKLLLGTNDLVRVIGSNKFMIITHDFKSVYDDLFRGILHTKPRAHGYTCRPQIVDDKNSNIYKILENVDSQCLINTSFNTHGRPILFSFESAIDDYRKQRTKDADKRLMLVILNKND